MTDEQFTIRVSHCITTNRLSPMEQLTLIKLSYSKMAFPERQSEIEPTYTLLLNKLRGAE